MKIFNCSKPEVSSNENPNLISYLTLRKTIGILGIIFPIVLIVGTVACGGCMNVQSSISSYYHTIMRNIFVGILCAIALFLFTYKGYDNRDSIAGNLAGLFALGVAFFPNSVEVTSCIPVPYNNGIVNTIHYISATGFFLVLTYFSLCLFRIKGDNPSTNKLKRNKIYAVCGIIILSSIAIIGLYSICKSMNKCEGIQGINLIFWLETIALWAFGLSWLTKGETILTDK